MDPTQSPTPQPQTAVSDALIDGVANAAKAAVAVMQAPPPAAPAKPAGPAAAPPPVSSANSAAESVEVDGVRPPETAPWGRRLRFYAWKYGGSMVTEPTASGQYVMSLGKTCAAALLIQAMVHWGLQGTDITSSMKEVLMTLLGYNLGVKGINVAHQFVVGGPTVAEPSLHPPKPLM